MRHVRFWNLCELMMELNRNMTTISFCNRSFHLNNTNMKFNYFKIYVVLILASACLVSMQSCKPKTAQSAASGDASKSFVAPGKYDEFYNFVSGGFNGQVAFMAFLPVVCFASFLFFPNLLKTDMDLVKKQNQC